jgi:copper homeostasis protein
MTSFATFRMKPNILVEVCVDSVASALAAQRGGAARVELCSGMMEGGVTPSAGLIEAVRAAVSIAVHVMIRPRGGDFFYDADELAIMRRDITNAKQLGANGVVLGILDLDGKVDAARTRELVELARPLEVTFHRAFDMAADLSRALEDVCATGATRLLTSGGEQTSIEGRDQIARLVQQAGSRIIVMPGSGIKPENARALVEHIGASEIHVGLRSAVPSPMRYQNPRIAMGSIASREYEHTVVLEENVRKLCAALDGGVAK